MSDTSGYSNAITELEHLITEEQKVLDAALNELGRHYFEIHKSNAEPIFAQLISRIKDSKDKLNGHKKELEKLSHSRKCAKCGFAANEGAVFCTRCGNELCANDDGQKAHTERLCPNCAAPAEDSASFCIKCGKPLKPKDDI